VYSTVDSQGGIVDVL